MAETLRVVSYNTWKCEGAYRDRLNWMAEGLAALTPDLLCLQEAFSCEDAEAGADTAGFLADALGFRAEVLRARGKQRQFEGAGRMSFSSLAILARWPMRRGRDVELAALASDPDRAVMQVEVEVAEGSLHLVNCHLTHIRGDEGVKKRKQQAAQVAQVCRASEADAVILCGDLNAQRMDPELEPLREIAWSRAANDTSEASFIGPNEAARPAEPRRIDAVEVLARPGVDVYIARRFTALNSPVGPDRAYPSDHAAVVADIELSRIKGGEAR